MLNLTVIGHLSDTLRFKPFTPQIWHPVTPCDSKTAYSAVAL